MKHALYDPLMDTGQWQQLEKAIRTAQTPCAVFGACEGKRIHLIAALHKQLNRPLLVIAPGDARANQIAADIEQLTGEGAAIFPARAALPRHVSAASRELAMRRLDVLGRAQRGETGIIIAPADALVMPLAPPDVFRTATLTLREGDTLKLEDMLAALTRAGYVREARVEGAGQFAVRGGIVDIFATGHELPVRIEFFDVEIDRISTFDVWTQRSLERRGELRVFPATEAPLDHAALAHARKGAHAHVRDTQALLRQAVEQSPQPGAIAAPHTLAQFVDELLGALEDGSHGALETFMPLLYPRAWHLWDYLPDPIIVMDEPARHKEMLDGFSREYDTAFGEALRAGEALACQRQLCLDWRGLVGALTHTRLVAMQDQTRTADISPKSSIRFAARELPSYRGQLKLLADDLRRWQRDQYRVLLLAGNAQRAARVCEALRELSVSANAIENDRPLQGGEVVALPLGMRRGYEEPGNKLVLLGEGEVFGTFRRKRRVVSRKGGVSMDLFSDLSVGDYVVHEAHGVGVFRGITKLSDASGTHDYMLIEYKGDDRLYVPAESVDRLEKYIGQDGVTPHIHRLNGTEWESSKQKARAKIVEIAGELVRLYALREMSKGFAYSPDNQWQRQFEDEFPYEETPDQLRSIEQIKRDMQSERVMDRLLCGDVGYGKTEVALRAAFKAVQDARQVAVLAPTTVLAYQHYNTFTQRFANYGANIELLSRFRTPAQQKASLRRLAQGKADIVIGTHRLLSRDVQFNSLGLLIVDEEQRFGVRHKERIKQMKASVDVLTLTATPIPRTLSMSLSGIRDISVIETPPEDRQVVQTYVLEYDEVMVRDAILREVARGGQVYFVYNRVETMPAFERRLQQLVPEARIICGHGQMPENALEKVMVDFYEGNYDVLLSTTIIENGLDIPRANTLIVYDADHFGLAQLYQLRGRVGRSSHLAYAYLTYRPQKALSELAEKRLSAIREFTEFGSGFKIAMRDLELRGAGNLLGGEQHGHIASIGYALYCRMLDEEVRRLKGEEVTQEIEVKLDLTVDAHIPQEYIADVTARLEVYRRIAQIDSESARSDVCDELIDRFGDPPASVLNLLDVAVLKALAAAASIEYVQRSSSKLTLRFAPGAAFDPAALLGFVAKNKQALTLSNGATPMLIARGCPGDWAQFFTYSSALLTQICLCIHGGDCV